LQFFSLDLTKKNLKSFLRKVKNFVERFSKKSILMKNRLQKAQEKELMTSC
jgi:hypothetical protein